MKYVNEIFRLFKAACNSHAKVDGTPSDDNAISLKEDLLNMCLQITFEGTDDGDLSGAIIEEARYKRVNMNGASYDRQLAARKNYNDSIAVNNNLRRAK